MAIGLGLLLLPFSFPAYPRCSEAVQSSPFSVPPSSWVWWNFACGIHLSLSRHIFGCWIVVLTISAHFALLLVVSAAVDGKDSPFSCDQPLHIQNKWVHHLSSSLVMPKMLRELFLLLVVAPDRPLSPDPGVAEVHLLLPESTGIQILFHEIYIIILS